VVATVITEKPEVPELEQKINDIIRSAVINTNQNPAVGVGVDDVTAQKLASQAAVLINRGDFKEAQRLLAEAVKQKPDFAEAWVMLGMRFVKLGNDKEAKNAYETALRIHSKRYAQQPNPNELLQQSYVLLLLGRENAAQQLLNQAKAEYPNNQQVMLFSEGFNKVKGDWTEYCLSSNSDMQVEGEKTELEEHIEKISRLINAELPGSVSNVKFHQKGPWGILRTFVKFDIPFSDLKMLLRQSYMLPDFDQLSKDGEIRIPMQKDKIGPDWWKPEELKETLYGHWARGYYAPEGIDIWIHYEWNICCSEINQHQMRVYLYSWSEGDIVYWVAPKKKQIIEGKLKEVLDDPNVIRQTAEQFFNKIRTADYDYFLNSKNPKVWKEFPIVGHYNALQGYQYPDLVMWICRTFKKNPIISVQFGNPIASMDKWPVLPYTITLKDGKIIEGDLRFTYHLYGPEQVYGKEVVNQWLGVHGIDWNLKPESELYQIPNPDVQVEAKKP
jgi:tetratricopeptide (TPR) repeat protein